MNQKTKKITLSGVCLALCLLLPFLTGQIPEIGSVLSPMHIPVLLCGFLCGWQYGLVVGFIAPLLRFLLFQMPPIFPIGTAMAFELAAYGTVTGLLYRRLPKKNINIYIVLITAMLIGRIVWGCAQLILSGITQNPFTWQAFISGAFITAIPGIIIHILIIPPIVIALRKTGLLEDERVVIND
ncbi:MAG: ECF transporter S component [Lachnospiraceae bacterium]